MRTNRFNRNLWKQRNRNLRNQGRIGQTKRKLGRLRYTMKQAAISMRQMTKAVITLGSTAMQGAVAGNSLRKAIEKLQCGTPEGEAALRRATL
jgi:hypothetical protein